MIETLVRKKQRASKSYSLLNSAYPNAQSPLYYTAPHELLVANLLLDYCTRERVNSVTKKLLKSLKYPLAAPSANISSKISPVSKDAVKDAFGKKIKFILDGGRSKIGLESTIVSLINKPEILRLGGIEVKKIKKIIGFNIKYNNQEEII